MDHDVAGGATALVRDCDSYRRLRVFTLGLNVVATLPLCLLLIPSVFEALVGGLLKLPREVADLTYGALWLFLPWTAAIGYRRFVHGVMIQACAMGQALSAFDPLFGYWFETVSGLTPELAAYAAVPVLLLVPLPALSVWLSYQRAVNVLRRRTKPITVATILEMAGIAVIFAVAGWGLDLVGVTAAAIAFLGGRLLSNLYLEARGESSRSDRERSRAWTARRP